MNEDKDYFLEIEKILNSTYSKKKKREKLEDYHENDIADALERLDKESRLKLYSILTPEIMSEVFTYIDDASEYIEEMDNELVADIIEEMDVDDAIDLLEDLEDEQEQELIKLIEDEEVKEDINLIQSYEEDELGSVMTTNFIEVEKDLSIRKAMKSLIEQAEENDNISTIYVTDNGKFYGAIDLKDLICARKEEELDDIVTTQYPYVYDHDTIEDKINYMADYEEDSIPVLNYKQEVIGVITSTDIIELVDEMLGDDYAKLAGLTGEEDLKETTIESMKKRIPWLLILLVLGLVVSSVVGVFERVVAQLTIVICFQSLILDMAGNVGTQSLAVTIRVLTDENMKGKQIFKLIFKEVKVGSCIGAFLGIISFVFVGLYIWVGKGFNPAQAYSISACIGIALALAMVISSLTGTVIPIFFHHLGVDPAVASGPLITTVNDLVAVVTYYGLTWILLINLLGL